MSDYHESALTQAVLPTNYEIPTIRGLQPNIVAYAEPEILLFDLARNGWVKLDAPIHAKRHQDHNDMIVTRAAEGFVVIPQNVNAKWPLQDKASVIGELAPLARFITDMSESSYFLAQIIGLQSSTTQ